MSRGLALSGIVPDRLGETTILGACVRFGRPFREVRSVFVRGRPPKSVPLGRADVWGVWWAPVADLEAVLGGKVQVRAAIILAARTERAILRRERLRLIVGGAGDR